MQLISNRNAIAKQIDYNNPESMMQGVNALTQAGDTVGAMQLADVARKMQSEMAQRFQRTAAGQASLAQATREQRAPTTNELTNARAIALQAGAEGTPEYNAAFTAEYSRLTAPKEAKEPTTSELTNARALAALKGAPGTPEYNAEFQTQLARLTTKDVKEPTTSELTNARAIALQAGPVGSPEFNTAFMNEYNRLTAPKEPKLPSVGGDREAVALEVYNKAFAELTPEQRAAVNKRVEAEQKTKAAAGASTLVMPGQRTLADVPAFRASVQRTIEPQLKSIDAADQALQAIEDSIRLNNFVSFNAARTQLARALGDSQLSRRDIEQAGGDPSLLGGLYDATSRLFTGTPSLDTQNKIKATLNAIRVVSSKKAQAEVDAQRRIALQTPGYDAGRVSEALNFPQLQGRVTASDTGSLAEQAAAELARRRAK